MRRFLFGLALTLITAYVLLHVVLGSTPVQRRVISEMRAQLKTLGLDLKIESIEFSALFPRIYLNRVTVLASDEGKFKGLPAITIDKIKFEFQPLALLVREVQVTELSFFHPVFVVSNVQHWIPIFQREFGGNNKKKTVTTPIPFRINIKKVGLVDALMDLKSASPAWAFTSNSLTFYFMNSSASQYTIQAELKNAAGRYENSDLKLNRFDLDVDVSAKSFRLNRLLVEGESFNLTTTGVSSLDILTQKRIPASSALAIDYEGEVAWLNRIGLLGQLPELSGAIGLHVKAKTDDKLISTSGNLTYKEVVVDGYRIGTGRMQFESDPKNVLHLKEVSLNWANGELASKDLSIGLTSPYPIAGKLKARGMSLKALLADVRTPNAPADMRIDGEVNVRGGFVPFEIVTEIDTQIANLYVAESDPKNNSIDIPGGTVKGTLSFYPDRMAFDDVVEVLGGTAEVKGHLGFHKNPTELTMKATNLSFNELKHISNLQVRGLIPTLEASLTHTTQGVRIAGDFTTTGAELESVRLGDVQGQVHFESGLLTFDNLVMASNEPILGRGYVDFSPEKTHYKFQAEVKRAELARVFKVFPEGILPFPAPTGGELSGRVFIEGGRGGEGLEIEAAGQAKDFQWYGEHWHGANFSTNFRPKHTSLRRILLFKRTGALQVNGTLDDGETDLHIRSHSLRLEEFSRFKGTSLSGEILGDVHFKMKQGLLNYAGGKLQAKKFTFRSAEIPEWNLNMASDDKLIRSTFATSDGSLTGSYRHPLVKQGDGELGLNFIRFDGLPWLSAFLGVDLDTFQEMRIGGRVDLTGSLDKWGQLRGGAKLDTLRMGLRNGVLENKTPIEISTSAGEFRVAPFRLEGGESQFSGDWVWSSSGAWSGKLDGRSDVAVLRPFLPFVESASGKLLFGVRATGSAAKRDFLGNARIENGNLRFKGMADELKSLDAQLTLSKSAINFDRFEATVNGGRLNAGGDIGMDLFSDFVPRLQMTADRVLLNFMDGNLNTLVTGNFSFSGKGAPYLIKGTCDLVEANLLKLEAAPSGPLRQEKPVFNYDIECQSNGGAYVKTDLLNAEFKGDFHLVGRDTAMGLLGATELVEGSLLFRETKFVLTSGVVKFESESRIAPRFNLAGNTRIREENTSNPAEYEVALLTYGVPEDYRIRLTSSPALTEPEIISLLVLGFTGRGNQEGSFMDLGSAVMGQIPLQSKIQGSLGFDIKVKSRNQSQSSSISSAAGSGEVTGTTTPSVVIQKDITRKTRLSVSSTLDTAPTREFRVEQLLNDNLSINATTTDSTKNTSATTTPQSSQSYGVDFRYRFTFE